MMINAATRRRRATRIHMVRKSYPYSYGSQKLPVFVWFAKATRIRMPSQKLAAVLAYGQQKLPVFVWSGAKATGPVTQ